jgi:hypothetical protein
MVLASVLRLWLSGSVCLLGSGVRVLPRLSAQMENQIQNQIQTQIPD